MSTWPTVLPLPLLAGYSGQQTMQTARTEMEVGTPRVRRRSAVRFDEIDVEFVLTATQLALFRDWFDATGSATNAGTAQAGAASTITLASAASSSDDYYNGSVITITAGTGEGQTRVITDYVGATRVATVGSAWTTTPDSSSVYDVSGGSQGGAGWFTTSLDDGGGLVSCEARIKEWRWSQLSKTHRRVTGKFEVRYA